MQITRSGTQPSTEGPADWFTGTVRIDPLFAAEPPSQFEVLTVGGFQGLAQRADFLAVAAFELGELGGERAHHAAGLVGVGAVRRDR